MRRTAILFKRIGPYHHSRLQAAAQSAQVIAVELDPNDATYGWIYAPSSTDYAIRPLPVSRRRRALWALLSELRPEAVAIPGWSEPLATIALLWCRLHRVPAILMSESQSRDASRHRVTEWIKRHLLTLYSAALVGGSRHEHYLRLLQFPSAAIFTGYDVVDNDHFASGAQARDDLEAYFLACVRFIQKKNLIRLIDAYAAHCRTSPDAWPLKIAGSGPLEAELRRRVEQLGLVRQVHFCGFVQYDDLPQLYGQAGAFVHVSTSEQWGLVVNEALASGLPVIVSSACGCVPELVEDQVNGYCVDPFETSQITSALAAIQSDPTLRSRMSEASLRIIAKLSCSQFGRGLAKAVESARLTHERATLLGVLFAALTSFRRTA